MRLGRCAVPCLLLALALGAAPADAAQCKMEPSYPPPQNHTLPWYTLDLDQAPEDRWTAIVQPRAAAITAMVDEVLTYLVKNPKTQAFVTRLLDKGADLVMSKFPAEYAAEFRGIQKATGVDVGMLAVMQIMYEVEGACTSIVAQNADGNVYHGRNLDFGLFDGWDNVTKTWSLTERLRPLLVNVHVVKGGQNMYNATYFAGFVGLLTGAKRGGFSITVNTRFDANLDKYLVEWLEGKWDGTELSVLTRSVMEGNATYDDALHSLTTTPIAGPAYLIIGGTSASQGAVITRNASQARDVWTLDQQRSAGKYFLVQTNHDHWHPDPFYDDRRGPAEECLTELGAASIRPETMFNVLSGKPNRNQLTTYTTIMHVASGRYEGYLQYCPHPCAPW